MKDIDTTDIDLDNWLRRHDIYDLLDPLETIVRVQPTTLRMVLRVAMMAGIHAGHKQQALGLRYADIERTLDRAMRTYDYRMGRHGEDLLR